MNIKFKGIISNQIKPSLYLCDLDGSIINVEGSPVFLKETNSLIGVRLPNLHINNLLVTFSTFTPLSGILEEAKSINVKTKVPSFPIIV